MPRNSQQTFDSLAQASAALNLPIAEIRRAKVRGCLAFRSGRIYAKPLKAWLRANPLPATPRRPARPATAPTPATPADEIGAAFALRRLEREEVAAFNRLQDAVASGDAVLANEARRAWCQTLDFLRKSDLAVEQSRRVTGEMLPKDEVIESISLLLSLTRTAGRFLSYANAPALAGASVAEAADIIDGAYMGGMLDSMAGNAAMQKLPPWLKDAALAVLNRSLRDAAGEYELRLRHFYKTHGVAWPVSTGDAGDARPLCDDH